MRALSNLPEFIEEFGTPEKCLQYLCELKWGNGYKCHHCKHTVCIKARVWYYRRCQNCKKEESCLAFTLFHKLKFPITTAFVLIHQLSTSKKGISCCEISRRHNVTVKTAWFFRRKFQEAALEGKLRPFKELFEDCEREEQANEQEIPMVEVTVKCSISTKRKARISGIKTNVAHKKDEKWNKALWVPISSGKSKAKKSKQGFKVKVTLLRADTKDETKLYLYRLRNWLGGIHHLVSLAHMERYLQEFQYRYDHRRELKANAKDMIKRFVEKGWLPYKMAKAS
jgi:hypothetical protein